MRTLLFRTGLSRGDAYTGTGQNLTSNPEGAGNYQVGGFYLDYSSIFPTSRVDDDLGEAQPLGTYTMNWDTEFSFVLADGRNLVSANNYTDPDDISFGDVDEDSDDGPAEFSVVPPGTNWATIDRIEVDLWIVPPDRYSSASVYKTDLSMSHPVEGTGVPLYSYLDALHVPTVEGFGGDYWVAFFRQLRWPLHWALLRVPCMGVDEGDALADEENDTDATIRPSRPTPFGGPRGLMAAQGGFSTVESGGEAESFVTSDLRLWEPETGTGFIRRGVEILNFTDEGSPTNQGDNISNVAGGSVMHDIDFVDDPPVPDVDSFQYNPGPFQGPGNIIHLRYTFKTDIRVRPNELIVFMIQSGRVRLSLLIEDNTPVASVIMGSPNSFLPECRHGPAFTLVHHSITAFHRRG